MAMSWRSILVVFVGLMVITSTTQAQRRNPRHLTGVRAADVARKTFEASVEARVIDRRAKCTTAFGNRVFCDCLSAALPLDVDFQRYIAVTTADRATNRPPDPEQRLRDVVLAVRDRCAAAAFGSP
jgi:hypothetical protein